MLEKESPWADNKIIICTGPDRLLTKKAAEDAITSLEGEWRDSGGCLTFGLANFYRLPYSKLLVQLPMSFSIPFDLEFREEKGFFPDL